MRNLIGRARNVLRRGVSLITGRSPANASRASVAGGRSSGS
jgi:hypothetical protein